MYKSIVIAKYNTYRVRLVRLQRGAGDVRAGRHAAGVARGRGGRRAPARRARPARRAAALLRFPARQQ